jgi:hypothetical protein
MDKELPLATFFVPEHLRRKACASTIYFVPRHTFLLAAQKSVPAHLSQRSKAQAMNP